MPPPVQPSATRHEYLPRWLDAIFVDAGGVLIAPSSRLVSQALQSFGGRRVTDTLEPHYRAVAEFDRTGDLRKYREAYASFLGVRSTVLRSATEHPVWSAPWTVRPPGAREATSLLAERFCVAVVSDSDGSVEEQLLKASVCQVGPGTLPRVDAVIDSAFVGVSKPDPAIFEVALATLGVDPERTVHLGDSRRCDVEGAKAAGIRPIHIDPLRLCEGTDHRHVYGLRDFADEVIQR